MSISLQEAAQLAAAAYNPKAHDITRNRIDRISNDKEALATLLTDGTLLIAGSDSVEDYVDFNLRIFKLFGKKYKFADPNDERGLNRIRWHQGFMTHAARVQKFVGTTRPKFIIGHSLGAASVQILCLGWGIPGIGFAPPRPKSSKNRVKHDDKILLICRDDDSVTKLPPHYHHVGRRKNVKNLKPKNPKPGMDHSMKHYIDILTDNDGSVSLPNHWP